MLYKSPICCPLFGGINVAHQSVLLVHVFGLSTVKLHGDHNTFAQDIILFFALFSFPPWPTNYEALRCHGYLHCGLQQSGCH